MNWSANMPVSRAIVLCESDILCAGGAWASGPHVFTLHYGHSAPLSRSSTRPSSDSSLSAPFYLKAALCRRHADRRSAHPGSLTLKMRSRWAPSVLPITRMKSCPRDSGIDACRGGSRTAPTIEFSWSWTAVSVVKYNVTGYALNHLKYRLGLPKVGGRFRRGNAELR